MNTSFEGALDVRGDVPCYSARFVQPFAQVLSTYESFAVESLNKLRAIDPATRIPAAVANELAVRQVHETGDVDLGLKAGRAMVLGRAGALDYAMHSAATVRGAIELANRFTRLFSDLLVVDHQLDGDRVTVRVDPGPSSRPVPDFSMSAWFTNHTIKPLADAPRLECWFSHPKPANTTEYERTFASALLRFDAPYYGFSFGREYLDAPLASADPVLHAVLCEHVALSLDQLSRRRTLSGRAREIAMRELLQGTSPTVFSVAATLRMSVRTLGRRLESEGTTFSLVLDHLRRELALRYVSGKTMAITEIAFRLGFSHVEAFYRAFKRWTGRTPLAYRRACGIEADGPILTSPGSVELGLPASPPLVDEMANRDS